MCFAKTTKETWIQIAKVQLSLKLSELSNPNNIVLTQSIDVVSLRNIVEFSEIGQTTPGKRMTHATMLTTVQPEVYSLIRMFKRFQITESVLSHFDQGDQCSARRRSKLNLKNLLLLHLEIPAREPRPRCFPVLVKLLLLVVFANVLLKDSIKVLHVQLSKVAHSHSRPSVTKHPGFPFEMNIVPNQPKSDLISQAKISRQKIATSNALNPTMSFQLQNLVLHRLPRRH